MALSAQVIFLSEPTMGIEEVAVTEQTQLVNSRGFPVDLRRIQPGESIEAMGESRQNTLLAARIILQEEPPKAVPPESGLSVTLDAPAELTSGENVVLEFTLTNSSDAGLYVLNWYTPLEGLGGEIFRVKRDGLPLPYEGPLAYRADPTPDVYLFLAAGASVSVSVDLTRAYDFSEPGEYTIAFLSPRISHVARTEAQMVSSVDDLGPVAMPSTQITVTIG
jgi:hypothetical protein